MTQTKKSQDCSKHPYNPLRYSQGDCFNSNLATDRAIHAEDDLSSQRKAANDAREKLVEHTRKFLYAG